MDNLQKHYLQQLAFANESALHGNANRCLDICFELRLKSDLALYTRVCVNLTLANFTRVQMHPDKSKFAAEALRLIRQLQGLDSESQGSVWLSDLLELESIALALLELAQKEEMELEEAWRTRASEEDLENESGNEHAEGESEDLGVVIEVERLELTPEIADQELEPWTIEGAFNVIPLADTVVVTQVGDAETINEDNQEDDDDGGLEAGSRELPSLPFRPARN